MFVEIKSLVTFNITNQIKLEEGSSLNNNSFNFIGKINVKKYRKKDT